MAATETPDLTALPWRTGRKAAGPGAHRTLYAMLGTEASDLDPLIGLLDTADLATEAVLAHNARVVARWPRG